MSSLILAPSPVSLPPITYKGRPVVTTEMLAEAYGCSAKNIRDNFNNNRERFIEGKHFYSLQNGDLQAFRGCTESFGAVVPAHTRNLTIWLEQGAARHAKMLNTEKAWDVFEMLEETFFRVAKSKTEKPSPHKNSTAELNARSLAISLRNLSRMKVYPDEMRATFAARAVAALTGEPLQPLLPPVQNNREKWLTATALGTLLNTSANAVGRLLKSLDLHGSSDPEHKHSQPVWDKSPHSNKEVVSYLYNPDVVLPRLLKALPAPIQNSTPANKSTVLEVQP